MKRKLITYLRIIGLIALAGLSLWGIVALGVMHRRTCPELYRSGQNDHMWVYFVLLALIFLLLPLLHSLGGLMSGYRLYRLGFLLIEVTHQEKLRIRLTRRAGFGAFMLPPRTDGTSPCVLHLLSLPLSLFALAGVFLLLVAIFWQRGISRTLVMMPLVCVSFAVIQLLPRRNGSDAVSCLLAFRNRDKRRAWECAMHISAALNEGRKLMDMPEAWFQTYPAEVADDLYVSNCIINGSSRLIRQRRFAEAYEMLRPLIDLAPTPETHQRVACVLLNGAICEALAAHENGPKLPPMCLSQLEHDSIKYMLPSSWTPRLLTAKYARALFIDHDETAAAALLDEIGKIPDPEQIDADLLRLMQEKAGLTTKEETP